MGWDLSRPDRAARGGGIGVVTGPRVSIVLVTRNGAATLPAVLDAIERQRFDAGIEIVAVDSSSTDATPDILRPRVKTLISIPVEAFDHGATRNTGIESTCGEFVVLLVQDAVPASADWLAALIAPLDADPRVAGSFARQRPRAEAGAITRHYLARYLASSETPRISAVADRESFAALEPSARLARCTFDDVCSCLRRSVWDTHRFEPTPIGEDVEWARRVLLDGFRIAYAPAAVVVHSHERSARHEYERTRLLHRRLYELFGLRTIPTAPLLCRAIAASLLLHWRCEPGWRGVGLALAWPAGQYAGGRSGARGARS